MKKYYIRKTGFEFFDISRAYGLAFILENFIESEEYEDKPTISEKLSYFEILIRDINLNKKRVNELLSLVDKDFLRRNVFSSLTGANARKREELIEKISRRLVDFSFINEILSAYQDIGYVPEIEFGFREEFDTREKNMEVGRLYLSLELAGVEGFRSEIFFPRGYDRTSKGCAYVDFKDWILSVIGHCNAGLSERGDKRVIAFLKPLDDLNIKDFKDIVIGKGGYRDAFRKIRKTKKEVRSLYHKGGVLPTLLSIAFAIKLRLLEHSKRSLFSGILYGVIDPKTTKPYFISNFPLEYINKINDPELVETFIILLNSTNNKKLANLAIYFSEFIINPELNSFSRYAYEHICANLRNDLNLFYKHEWIKEVLENVRTM